MVRWRTNDVQNGVVRVDTKQLSSLIRQEPISKYYNVEQPPFAVGAFASVCRVQHLQTGGEYAAKFCQRKRSGLDSTTEIHHEIALLSLCSPSPRIVRLHDVFQTPDQFVIIMEYAPGGDMQTIIDNNIVPFEADVVRFVQHVVEGLSYLHHRRIAHLDIKPQNLVLMGDFPHCDVKVCDFEISRVILDGSDIHEILGTPEYVAPEILHYEPITLAADMWSLGVTVYVLLTGFSPFGGETDQETFLNISRAQLDFPDELFDDVSEHAKDFIAKLLKRNPKDRMTAKQCLRHPWLANNKTRRYRRRQSKTTTTTSGGPTTSGGGTTATATNSAGGQLRKYLSKSREALFERVVAKHQQTSHGNRSRYDRTRRLCESQMSLVSRSREQLLLTGTKRCLSRDKLYGIRHLSKSHEVLNSLAEALVVKQLDGDKVGPATNQQSKSDVTASSQTAASPLQTVLTLICDSKNNNNDDKEQTKENGSSGTSAANNSQPKAVQTGSTPSTPETESKVLIAIEKLQQAINEKNNNRNKDNNRTSLDENKPTNSTTKTAQRKISLTDDHNRTLTTKTADQRKISLPDDHHKTQTITKTGDQRKISLTSAADDNKSQTSTKSAELNRNSSSPSTADQNKTFTTSKTADLSRNTPTTQRKRFTVSKTADLNRFSSNTDQNKTLNTDQTKTCLSRTAQLENSQSLVTDQSNKSVSSISSLSTTAEQHSKPTSKTADLKKMSSSSTSDQDNCSSPATKTADQPKILIEDKSADISKNRELSVADQSKMPTRPSRLLLNRQTSSQSADFKQTLTQSADSKQISPQSAESKQISPQSAESKQISPQSADVRQPYHQSVDLRKSSSQLTDSKELSADPSQTSSQSADLNSPVGGPNSLSPDGWEPTSLTSSEEADVSEPDSSSHQSTWQRQLEEDEPRFTVAQLVSAFNKHQALVTKTSLEVTMNIRGGAPESKILPDEISNHTINRKFPIGPDALRLFIPGIKISEHNLKKSPPSTPPMESLEKSLSTKSSEPTKKSPTTPPACENIEKIPPKSTENDKIDGLTREKQRKISSTTDKSGKIADKPTLDCSSVNTADFSPPTPPPPPPAPSSSETRNYKEFASRPTTRHRTSGRQATTLAASSKIRKKSNTTPKPPPFY